MICEKKCFKSKKAARKMISMAISAGARMRVYFCRGCSAFHVTKTQKMNKKGWRD